MTVTFFTQNVTPYITNVMKSQHIVLAIAIFLLCASETWTQNNTVPSYDETIVVRLIGDAAGNLIPMLFS